MFLRRSKQPEPDFGRLTDHDKSVAIQMLKDKVIYKIQNDPIVENALKPIMAGICKAETIHLDFYVNVAPEELQQTVAEMLLRHKLSIGGEHGS